MFPNENETSSQEINETLTFPDEIVETGGTGKKKDEFSLVFSHIYFSSYVTK